MSSEKAKSKQSKSKIDLWRVQDKSLLADAVVTSGATSKSSAKSNVPPIHRKEAVSDERGFSVWVLAPKHSSSKKSEAHDSGLDQSSDQPLLQSLDPWQKDVFLSSKEEVLEFETSSKTLWIVQPKSLGDADPFGVYRELVGSVWSRVVAKHSLSQGQRRSKVVDVVFSVSLDNAVRGSLLGLELSSYRFQVVQGQKKQVDLKLHLIGAKRALVDDAMSLGQSMNLARHLVNLDAAILNPHSYAYGVKEFFAKKKTKTVDVEVWDPDRLLEEKMDLHYAVGQASVFKSHMVCLRYRPKKAKLSAPIAVVGKGITFDTGGLDIKPPSGMRYMKKDMGGSATAVGIVNYLSMMEYPVSLDVYLALAENSVDAASFRPGDVIKTRQGTTVEIHNTDAEGRLVMADVFHVAQSQKHKPFALVDFSTLTGAMRVAVGTEIAGFFSNNDDLAAKIEIAAKKSADPAWRLPLWQSYSSQLRSTFADLSNASDSGFAGAITAALFLEKFVKPETPWIHFDLYCWNDKTSGALAEMGGNGQGIQLFKAWCDLLLESGQ